MEESDSSGVVLGLFGRLKRVRRMKGLRRRIRINNDSGSGGEAGLWSGPSFVLTYSGKLHDFWWHSSCSFDLYISLSLSLSLSLSYAFAFAITARVIYIYIYKTKAFEAPTIFHVSIIFK